MTIKEKIYNWIDTSSETQKSKWVNEVISGIIVLNICAILFESYKEFSIPYRSNLYYFELFSIAVFSLEYIFRIWTADLHYKENTPFKARLTYIFSFYGIIDLLAIMPFYLPMITRVDLRVLRSLRLIRLLRVFKLSRYSRSFKLLGEVLEDTKGDLAVTIFIVFILLIISSTLMFYIENEAQPEAFSNIGQSLWWAVATLTTVGYGDIYPITPAGKLLSGVIAILGIGIVALPTSILSSSFVEKIQERKKQKQKCTCPKCGEEFLIKDE